MLREYFRDADKVLEEYPWDKWLIGEKVWLYACCAASLDHNNQNTFECVFNWLKSHWQVFRPKSDQDHWQSERIWDELIALNTEFPQSRQLTLLSISCEDIPMLRECIERLTGIKKNALTPIMAISKFLHFYNPRLFPIFDGAFIRKQVLKIFTEEWSGFDFHYDLTQFKDNNEIRDYIKYIFWASSLLKKTDDQFAGVVSDFLKCQFIKERDDIIASPRCDQLSVWLRGPEASNNLRTDRFDWCATMFECIAIGASEIERQNPKAGIQPQT